MAPPLAAALSFKYAAVSNGSRTGIGLAAIFGKTLCVASFSRVNASALAPSEPPSERSGDKSESAARTAPQSTSSDETRGLFISNFGSDVAATGFASCAPACCSAAAARKPTREQAFSARCTDRISKYLGTIIDHQRPICQDDPASVVGRTTGLVSCVFQ